MQAPPSWDVVLGSGPTAFNIGWHAGTGFTATLPYSGVRAFSVTHVKPGSWAVTVGSSSLPAVTVGADGVLSFSATLTPNVTVTAAWTN